MTFNSIRNLLLQNSELVKGVRDADAILNAFGNVCDTEEHFDASKFGKYVEYQYNSDGTFLGIKLLDFFLQKQHIYSGQPFHIFNHLIAGATPAEKVEWYLDF
jgi:chitin synthase